jgi:hypothetical protein
MEYANLILGIILLVVFCWILRRNSKRTGLLHGLLRIDTLLGVSAGLYLIFSSIQALLIL